MSIKTMAASAKRNLLKERKERCVERLVRVAQMAGYATEPEIDSFIASRMPGRTYRKERSLTVPEIERFEEATEHLECLIHMQTETKKQRRNYSIIICVVIFVLVGVTAVAYRS